MKGPEVWEEPRLVDVASWQGRTHLTETVYLRTGPSLCL